MNHGNGLAQPACKFSRRQFLARSAAACGSLSAGSICAWAAADEEVSHTAESIHQEPVFKATPMRVYEALTDAAQFRKVVQLSGAVQSGMALGDKPVEVSKEVGGPFTIFGGHIFGRHLELLAGERIVQAWRVVDWNPGVYSIAKFQFTEHPFGTKIVFDHTGFPAGLGQHLAAGWKANYWEPLEKFLV
jgi:activator of HSP90 ATPase